jgi:aspartate/methionine/tyrosine aminotransferase
VLPDFRLETFFSRWEFTARYNLGASDAETFGLTAILALADERDRAAWESIRFGYTPTMGSPELRAAIAGTFSGLDPADVLCFAGAQEAIYCVMHALLSANDHAIVLVPNYQSTEEVPLAICEVTGIELREEEGWALDVEELRAALRPNTRLIAINFPNNPTGKVIDQETMDAVVAIAAERGLWLFSDEVYRGLERDRVTPLVPAAQVYDRALSLGVASKAYGLAGLRIGWMACRDREALARMERVKHYLSICNAAPSELLATIALKARDELLARNRRIVTANLGLLRNFAARHPALIEWYEPDGGCIAFPRYLGAEGVEEFCRSAVEEASVILLPGSLFESRLLPRRWERFRIGFGRADFATGLAALERHLTRD